MGKTLVHVKVAIPVNFFRDGDHFVAHTSALDLSTSGRTLEQAEERFTEIVQLFIEDLVEQGTLDEVLKSYGWQKVSKPKPHWAPPKLVRSDVQEASIPAPA